MNPKKRTSLEPLGTAEHPQRAGPGFLCIHHPTPTLNPTSPATETAARSLRPSGSFEQEGAHHGATAGSSSSCGPLFSLWCFGLP